LCPEKYGSSTYKQGTSENYFSVRIALGLAFGRIPVIPIAPSLPTSLQNTFHIQSGVLQWSEMVVVVVVGGSLESF